jgi:hypothetical protein
MPLIPTFQLHLNGACAPRPGPTEGEGERRPTPGWCSSPVVERNAGQQLGVRMTTLPDARSQLTTDPLQQ